MRSEKLVGNVLNMSYHRNGSSGRGFWTILFEGHPESEDITANHTFVATFFPKEEAICEFAEVDACVAVLRVTDIAKGNTEQAWRGDRFQDELQKIVDSYVWPFDRDESRQLDGAGREITHRRAAIKAQKAYTGYNKISTRNSTRLPVKHYYPVIPEPLFLNITF